MPRMPGIHYYQSRKAYYTKYQGRQHLLAAGPCDGPDGPTYKKAIDEFAKVMHAEELYKAEDNALFSTVVIRYFHSLKVADRHNTLRLSRTLLDPMIAALGHIKIKELRPYTVRDWVEAQPTWSSNTKYIALARAVRALYWAQKEGMITKNPLAEIQRPERRGRGKEVMLPESLQALLISLANRELSKVIRLLRGTGARPGEIINAECHHYRPDLAAIVLPWNPPPGEYRWKCAKQTKRDRVIYLTPDLQAIIETEIRHRGGKGLIFQTLFRQKWTGQNLVNGILRLASRKEVKTWCEVNAFDTTRIMAYSFRHSYMTRMLAEGCPVKTLADLCGTSVTQIEQTYSHVHEDLQAMRRLFLKFNGASSGSEPSAQSDPSRTDRRK